MRKLKELEDFGDRIIENLNRNNVIEYSVLSPIIRSAIHLAVQTHELDRKQKRKGKDIPYIVHPLTVGLILAKAGAHEATVAAGILHDTLEDSLPEKKVTVNMLEERCCYGAAMIVEDVTEKDKSLPWKQRKLEALKHIETMEGPALWVKTADVISNGFELLDDHKKEGERVFERFNAPRADIIANHLAVIAALRKRWGDSSDNPMVTDLKALVYGLEDLQKAVG